MMKGVVCITYRYCSPDEDKEIIALYKTGQYSYQQIADMKSLSKGTVINIVKGYPYNPANKAARYNKLQTESAAQLEAAIKQAEQDAKQAYEAGHFADYGAYLQLWTDLLKAVTTEPLYEHIRDTRQQYERQAWAAFDSGDYSQFGYYAETWDTLTNILGDNAKNPWKVISLKINAKGHSHSVKFAVTGFKGRNVDFLPMGKNSYTEISDSTWELIKPIFRATITGRHAKNRKTIDGILYALTNCRSFRTVPTQYGSRRNIEQWFAAWYKARYFADLLNLTDVCPELQAVRHELLAIVMHSLVHGSQIVPRLCDIKRAGEGKVVLKDGSKTIETSAGIW
jgi:hypothetical protein